MSLKVVENFLSPQNHNALYSAFTSEYFPWYYNNYKRDEDNNKLFHYQLTHVFFKHNKINSTYFTILESLLKELKLKALKKVKANLNPISDKLVEFGEHKDAAKESQYMSMIYYLNTNNGYTKIKNKKIKSKANKAVFFPSHTVHFGTNSTDCNNRMVLNIIYKED
tara:strand:- start:43 stop:540 length:498 start_codon:yes stop_codon:yes gene_type:complete